MMKIAQTVLNVRDERTHGVDWRPVRSHLANWRVFVGVGVVVTALLWLSLPRPSQHDVHMHMATFAFRV